MDHPLAIDPGALAKPFEEATARDDASQARHDIVVIGASAGGVKALRRLFAAMPAGYDGSVFVVMHITPESQSMLPGILSRAGPLRAVKGEDGAPIEPGCVYVAPPDGHLLVERGVMRVVHGPRENRHRPAIDPLFRSAAWAYGPRVIGVVLTGGLDDGTAGLWAVKSCGGVTVVQDPAEAECPDMPSNALMHNRIDHRLTLDEIAKLLVELLHRPPAEATPPPAPLGDEIEAVKLNGSIERTERLGTLSPFTCPSCQGAMWELEEGGHLRYRCHTGHAYTLPTLMTDQSVAVERSLYAALRAVEEKARALRKLSERWPSDMHSVKADYVRRANELDDAAEVLRGMLAGATS